MNRKRDLIKIIFTALVAVFSLYACASAPVLPSDTDADQDNKGVEESYKKKTIKSFTDYERQINYFKNRLKAEPKNTELHYDLATIYLTLRKYRTAHSYISKAIRYANTSTLSDKFKSFDRKIENDYYMRVKSKKNVAAYETFLKTYPDSFFLNNILTELEELKYKEAVAKNSPELLADYLREYPNTSHFRAIKYRLDEIAWEEVLKVNSVKAYQEFLAANPFSSFKEPALEKIDRIRFNSVKNIDTIEAYGGFIQKYPANKFIDEAKERIKTLQFTKIEKKGTIEEYEEYIKDNPDGLFVDASLEKIDELRYREAKESDNIEKIVEFIKSYPDSRYVYKAKRLLDVLRYEEAEKIDTIEAYEKFINDYPSSQFRHDALDRIDAIKKIAKIESLCGEGKKSVKEGRFNDAIFAFTEALNIDYSSEALFGIGKLYEKLGDIDNDFDNKIEFYYKAAAAFKVIQRKEPGYKKINKVLEMALEKRSNEQKVMAEARLRRLLLPAPFEATLITYSKKPVMIFKNTGDDESLSIYLEDYKGKYKRRLSVKPKSEVKKMFTPGGIRLKVKGTELDDNFSLVLFPYYEYTLRAK